MADGGSCPNSDPSGSLKSSKSEEKVWVVGVKMGSASPHEYRQVLYEFICKY